MHLIKWFRKNKNKIIMVVILIAVIGFIGGSFLQQLGRRRTNKDARIAYFGDGEEITSYDRALAQQELSILKMLQADNMLRGVGLSIFRMPDLRSLLLCELLFADRKISPLLVKTIEQLIRVNSYNISREQINDIYRAPLSKDIYWLLLKKEASQGGFKVTNDAVGQHLGRMIPGIFNGATYSQVITSIIKQQGISEEKILESFGNLLAVFEYARMICADESITSQQIKYGASLENQTMDIEFVRFASSVFAETQDEPGPEVMGEHFDKYKKFFPGSISEENPYGFGYKLSDRVQLEYIAVKLDDVAGIVTAPVSEDVEDFYQKNREQFTEQILSDPNDPNSPFTERILDYAEVADIIREQLLDKRINSKAEMILQQSRVITEAGFEKTDVELENLDAEQVREIAGDYKNAAEQLSNEYGITVYTGETGLLSAADMQNDGYLGGLFVEGYGNNIVGLTEVVFAIDELDASELGPFDVPKPRMYENIGSLKSAFGQTDESDTSITTQVMAIVRVVKAEKASEPESLEQTWSKQTFQFDESNVGTTESVYSLAEEVSGDLRKLAAMDTAKVKVEEFIRLIAKDGWEHAVDRFNELYEPPASWDGNDPNVFELQSLTDLKRISQKKMNAIAVQYQNDPQRQLVVNATKVEAQLMDKLYELVSQDKENLETIPYILEFREGMSYYVIKNLSVNRLNQDEYEKRRAGQAIKEAVLQSQNLAPVHFNPENILKRMNFKWANELEESDTDEPAESEKGS